MKFYGQNRRRRGLSLIETILAIAVGAIAVVAVIGFYTSGTAANNRSEANQQLQHIAAEMQTLYSGSAVYGNDAITEGDLAQAGIFPSTMLEGTGGALEPFNPWGGTVEVNIDNSNAETFTVIYHNVPRDACAKMISGNNSGFGGNLCGIGVGDGSVPSSVLSGDGGTQNCQGSRPAISEVDAVSACASATDENVIAWWFQ